MKMSRSLKAVNSDWSVTPEEKVIKKQTNTVFTGRDKEEQATFQGSKFSSGSLKQASLSNRKCPQKRKLPEVSASRHLYLRSIRSSEATEDELLFLPRIKDKGRFLWRNAGVNTGEQEVSGQTRQPLS